MGLVVSEGFTRLLIHVWDCLTIPYVYILDSAQSVYWTQGPLNYGIPPHRGFAHSFSSCMIHYNNSPAWAGGGWVEGRRRTFCTHIKVYLQFVRGAHSIISNYPSPLSIMPRAEVCTKGRNYGSFCQLVVATSNTLLQLTSS